MRSPVDLAAKDRDEDGCEFPMARVRRHDRHRSAWKTGDASVFEVGRGAAMTMADQREIAGVSARSGKAVALRTADWLCFAATPTFALMALLAGVLGGPLDAFCSAAHHASPLNGMVAMYLLMSAFHSAPWLRAIAGRRRGVRGS